ncbi:hypothetical protein C0Q63_31510 [Streptomyces albidoflavus]|nr:hypothetical protein C0Q63_31510 [Streptomyces albidoflavus]
MTGAPHRRPDQRAAPIELHGTPGPAVREIRTILAEGMIPSLPARKPTTVRQGLRSGHWVLGLMVGP